MPQPDADQRNGRIVHPSGSTQEGDFLKASESFRDLKEASISFFVTSYPLPVRLLRNWVGFIPSFSLKIFAK